MDEEKLKNIVEAALLAAGGPLSLDNLMNLFLPEEQPERNLLRQVIAQLQEKHAAGATELVQVGGGFRINVRAEFAPWVSRLWSEKPPRYSRALMETLAIIAYRQPITRGEIEDIRGVAVSSNIVRTLTERQWVREVGHRDVPGKPALLATTREFLNYFGLKGLGELPTLAEIKDFDSINCELELEVSPGEGESQEAVNEMEEISQETISELNPAAEEEEVKDNGLEG